MGKDALPIASASIDGVTEIVLTDTDLTSLTFDGVAGTITAAAGDFITAGIQAGDRVIIDGDGITDNQNRNPRTVVAITTTTLTVAEAIQTGGPYVGPFTVTRVGLPEYTLAPDSNVLVAVSGAIVYKGQVVGTVTAASMSIDNQMAGSTVVGANTIPANLYGNQCSVTGSLTVLFDRGGIGEQIYNAFDLEEDDVSVYLTLTTPGGADAMSFVIPRAKINTGTIGDAVAEGLPVSCDFQALKPLASSPQSGRSQIHIIDTSILTTAVPITYTQLDFPLPSRTPIGNMPPFVGRMAGAGGAPVAAAPTARTSGAMEAEATPKKVVKSKGA